MMVSVTGAAPETYEASRKRVSRTKTQRRIRTLHFAEWWRQFGMPGAAPPSQAFAESFGFVATFPFMKTFSCSYEARSLDRGDVQFKKH
jgi:hypothetical protein